MLELLNVGPAPITTLKSGWTDAVTAILKGSVPVRYNLSIETRDASVRVFDQNNTSLYSFTETSTIIRTHTVSVPIGTTALRFQTAPRAGASLSLNGSTIYLDVKGDGVPVASRLVELRNWSDAQLNRIAFSNNPELTKVPSALPWAVRRYNNSFSGCTNLNDPNISSWNMSLCTLTAAMFQSCARFNQPINHWDVSNIAQFTSMLRDCSDFNQPLNNWNVANAVMMDNMFNLSAKFNQPLNLWNTGNLQYMQNMFRAASTFNQNLSGWNVSKVINRTDYDADCPAWLAINKPIFA